MQFFKAFAGLAAGALALTSGSAAAARAVAAADELWGAATIPAGVRPSWQVARNIPTDTATPSFLVDLARYRYNTTLDEGVMGPMEALPLFWEYVASLQAALGAYPGGLALSPALAQDRRARQRLEDTLDLLGLELASSRGQYRADVRDDAVSRRQSAWASTAGLDTTAIAARLTQGQTIPREALTIKDDEVPLPLPSLWQSVLRVEPAQAAMRIVGDDRAHLLYVGLAALDRDTLAWLVGRPAVFKDLYENRASAFAAFGRSVRIRDNAVQPPGAGSKPVWEDLVDAPLDQPEEFLRKLLSKDDGRLAYFYDTVAHLDDARQQFLLGEQLGDTDRGRARLRYVHRVLDVFKSAASSWVIERTPMVRPDWDPMLLVSVLEVRPGGIVGPDWWPDLFERVSGTSSWPRKPADTTKRLGQRRADAPWVLDWLVSNPDETAIRFKLIRYLQRCCAGADRALAPSMEVTLRTLKDMPALALALERMGVRDPRAIAAAGYGALALTQAGGPAETIPAVRAWQGSLGVLEQLARHGTLRDPLLTQVLQSLSVAVPIKAGEPNGTVAHWFIREFLARMGVADEPAAASNGTVLAKLLAPPDAGRVLFQWEGLPYQIDMLRPAAARATDILDAMPGPTIAQMITLARADAMLAKGVASLDELAALAASLEPLPKAFESAVDGEGKGVGIADDLRDAVQAFRNIRTAKDLPKAGRRRAAILRALDHAVAEIAPNLTYALAMVPTGQPAGIYSDGPVQHTYGTGPQLEQWKVTAWTPPRIEPRPTGGGTRLTGALLGIDLVRAADRLISVAGWDPPTDRRVPERDLELLAVRASMRATGADWEAEGRAIATAAARGKARVASWASARPAADALAADLERAGFSEWRRNALEWLVARADWTGVERFVTARDWYRLGTNDALPAAWGQTGEPFDGCWCLRAPSRRPVEDWLGRRAGLLAAESHDLAVYLSLQLTDLGLPYALIEPLLLPALKDATDSIAPFAADDWETFSWAKRLTPERVEAYLQGLRQRQILAQPHATVGGGSR